MFDIFGQTSFDNRTILPKLSSRRVCRGIATQVRSVRSCRHLMACIVNYLVNGGQGAEEIVRLFGLGLLFRRLPLLQTGNEIHFERVRQFRRRAEREVHVLPQHLRDVWLRDLHALRQLGLVHAELLHPAKNAAEKRRANMVKCLQKLCSLRDPNDTVPTIQSDEAERVRAPVAQTTDRYSIQSSVSTTVTA